MRMCEKGSAKPDSGWGVGSTAAHEGEILHKKTQNQLHTISYGYAFIVKFFKAVIWLIKDEVTGSKLTATSCYANHGFLIASASNVP